MLVSVCMCVYKRESLERTLASIIRQKLPDGYSVEVVVFDNDIDESGRARCEKFQQAQTDVDIRYFVNGVRNLSVLRNATMEHAKGELLLFIDDDEWASTDDWLAQLITTMHEYNADIVFGRVLVHYPEGTPKWIVEGDLLGKVPHAHGKKLTKGATSNALMKAHWAREREFRFDPFFGKSGGEDTDLFNRIYKAGGILIYDANALVEEVAEPQRLNLEYIKKLNIRIGQTHYHYLWSKQRGFDAAKTLLFVIAQVAGYGLLTLVTLPFNKGWALRWYVRLIRNMEKLTMIVTGGRRSVELYGNN